MRAGASRRGRVPCRLFALGGRPTASASARHTRAHARNTSVVEATVALVRRGARVSAGFRRRAHPLWRTSWRLERRAVRVHFARGATTTDAHAHARAGRADEPRLLAGSLARALFELSRGARASEREERHRDHERSEKAHRRSLVSRTPTSPWRGFVASMERECRVRSISRILTRVTEVRRTVARRRRAREADARR